MASGSTACTASSENTGQVGAGKWRGMPPKRVPMVSTGSESAQVPNAATATAIRMPGQVGRSFLSATIMRMLTLATAIAETFAVGNPCASVSSFGMSWPGSLAASLMPSSSLSWLAKMMTAIPAVNPTVTG